MVTYYNIGHVTSNLTAAEIANDKLRVVTHQIAHRHSTGERNLALRMPFIKTAGVEVIVVLDIIEGFFVDVGG